MTNLRLASFSRLPYLYPESGITEGALRWARFKNIRNFNRCVLNRGNRLEIDLDRFESWLDGGLGEESR